jgi:hypothetical protein
MRLKIPLLWLPCLFALLLTGCGPIPRETGAHPDPRTGPNLIIPELLIFGTGRKPEGSV